MLQPAKVQCQGHNVTTSKGSMSRSQFSMTITLWTSRPYIYEIDSDVMLCRPFRETISKMEDSNKETSLKPFKMLFLLSWRSR